MAEAEDGPTRVQETNYEFDTSKILKGGGGCGTMPFMGFLKMDGEHVLEIYGSKENGNRSIVIFFPF